MSAEQARQVSLFDTSPYPSLSKLPALTLSQYFASWSVTWLIGIGPVALPPKPHNLQGGAYPGGSPMEVLIPSSRPYNSRAIPNGLHAPKSGQGVHQFCFLTCTTQPSDQPIYQQPPKLISSSRQKHLFPRANQEKRWKIPTQSQEVTYLSLHWKQGRRVGRLKMWLSSRDGASPLYCWLHPCLHHDAFCHDTSTISLLWSSKVTPTLHLALRRVDEDQINLECLKGSKHTSNYS